MQDQKCAFQKMYEKLEMAKRSPDLMPMLAKRDTGEWAMFACYNSTPLARLMDQRELLSWTPDHKKSEAIQTFCTEWADKDLRLGDQFDENGPKGMEDAFTKFVDRKSMNLR
jgi:hypothetical protein